MLRFAPSPTGDMHIGNLRVALINYLLSKQRGEPFLVRIEDTDTARNIHGKDTEIMQILEKFALAGDQVFHQSEHRDIHRNLAYKLLKQNKAFLCTCSQEELDMQRENAKKLRKPYRYDGRCFEQSYQALEKLLEKKLPFTIRIKKPDEAIAFTDMIKGEIRTDPHEVDSFVILRADGSPTYNFACACDDMLSDISLVVRGEDHLPNTPKQLHIQKMLGYDNHPRYAHLPMILNEEGKKMSKRDNAGSVRWLFKEGFIPDAIANYLLLLGNPQAPEEVFTLPEAVEWFDLRALSKSAAKFDLNKLRFLNREHLKKLDDKKLSRFFGFADEAIGKLAKVYLEEASTLKELEVKIKAIFSKQKSGSDWSDEIEILRTALKEAPPFETFDALKIYLIERTGLKGKSLFKPLRILLTGSEHGPELSDIYPHLKSYLLEVIA